MASLKALDAVDLRVAASEFVPLLGLNGAGRPRCSRFSPVFSLRMAGAYSSMVSRCNDPPSALKGLGIVFRNRRLISTCPCHRAFTSTPDCMA